VLDPFCGCGTTIHAAEKLNRENIFLQDNHINEYEGSNDDLTELAILRVQHMTVYYLYLVDWHYVNSKYWSSRKDSGKPKPIKLPKPAEPVKSPAIIEGINLNSDDDDSAPEEKAAPTPRRVPKPDTSEPHPDGIPDVYEFEFLDLADMKNQDSEEYYFYITSKESKQDYIKLIKPLYIDRSDHYKLMIKYITEGEPLVARTAYPVNKYEPYEIPYKIPSSLTPVKRIFKTTFSHIESARSRSFIHLNCDVLKGISAKKKKKPIE
jgi:hypothetical protein